MTKIKKIAAFMLCLLLILSANVFAADYQTVVDSDYDILNGVLLSYNGSDSVVTLPYNITAIGGGAFKDNKNITSVTIPSNITSIGAEAFENCSNLETVNLDGVWNIEVGSHAFEGTKWLQNYSEPYVTIGRTLIKYKGSKSAVEVPVTVNAVASDCFEYSGSGNVVSQVTIPDSVTKFYEDCLYTYTSSSGEDIFALAVVKAGSEAENYCKSNGIGYKVTVKTGDVDIDGKVTAIDARKTLRVSAGLSPMFTGSAFDAADVDKNGEITAVDARHILRIAANLENPDSDLPSSASEAIETIKSAVDDARSKRPQYTKFSYQEFVTEKINKWTIKQLMKNGLTDSSSAASTTYKEGSDDSYSNLYNITFSNPDAVDSWSASTTSEGYTKITVTLANETVGSDDIYTTEAEKLFPIETAAKTKARFDDSRMAHDSSLNDVNFNVIYHHCTLVLTIDPDTGNIVDLTEDMYYYFQFDGKLGGTKIQAGTFDSSPAVMERHDHVLLSSFDYNA